MATEKKTWKGLLSAVGKKEGKPEIGDYEEYPGGGTPLPKGAKAPSKAWVEANRKMQPRDTNGQFTYNSANKKPLEYGPSRGKSIPPFLRGVELTFAKKSGKGAFIGVDGKKYKLPENIKTAADFVNSFKEHTEGEGFKGFGKIEDAAIGKGGKTGEIIKLGYDKFMSSFKSSGAKKGIDGSDVFKKNNDNDKGNNTNPFELAKTDLGAFKKKYANEIKDVADLIDNAGYDSSQILTDELWQNLPDFENTHSFDDLKKQLEDALR